MPTLYSQTVVNDASGTMTGWANGDPNRFVEVATEVEVDPVIWDLWTRSTFGPNHWDLGGRVTSILPDSGGNNLPHLQIRWDSDGIWRTTSAGLQSGSGLSSGSASETRPSTQTTMSFRMANINDEIIGLFTPRSFDRLTIQLNATPPPGPPTEYTQARLVFGVMAYTVPSAATRRRRSRSYAAVIG